MATNSATINIRLQESVKKRGDAVLKKCGVSPSQAVRSLWEQMATDRHVPEFIMNSIKQDADAKKSKQKKALDNLRGIASIDMTDKELDEFYFQSLIDDYNAIK